MLYWGCGSVTSCRMHVSESNAHVSHLLVIDSTDAVGAREEPTLVRLDTAKHIRTEVERTNYFLQLGTDAPSCQLDTVISRGPVYCKTGVCTVSKTDVLLLEAGSVGAGDFGGIVLELKGGCWTRPELAQARGLCRRGRAKVCAPIPQRRALTAAPRRARRRVDRGARVLLTAATDTNPPGSHRGQADRRRMPHDFQAAAHCFLHAHNRAATATERGQGLPREAVGSSTPSSRRPTAPRPRRHPLRIDAFQSGTASPAAGRRVGRDALLLDRAGGRYARGRYAPRWIDT
eukprot:7036357-Prymnesium_polylepis.1